MKYYQVEVVLLGVTGTEKGMNKIYHVSSPSREEAIKKTRKLVGDEHEQYQYNIAREDANKPVNFIDEFPRPFDDKDGKPQFFSPPEPIR